MAQLGESGRGRRGLIFRSYGYDFQEPQYDAEKRQSFFQIIFSLKAT